MPNKITTINGELIKEGCILISREDREDLGLHFGGNLVTGIVGIGKVKITASKGKIIIEKI